MPDSEFRLYGYILESLKSLGWDTRSPSKGGQVYTQNEISQHRRLKAALGRLRPENVVVVGENSFWVIEAKGDLANLELALEEAEDYANRINEFSNLSCQIVTGIAGSPETTHYIETRCLVEGSWQPLVINKRRSTGFISPRQVTDVLNSGNASLDEFDIDDALFNEKVIEINSILHDGAINKRNRAGVLSCLLLALAQDEKMEVNNDPEILIRDINSRAEQMLRSFGKGGFYREIAINLPASEGNHIKHRDALKKSIEVLRGMNIASAISSGRDVLGQCYERFLKYANDAKEIGIVLTPRNITTFAAELANVKRNDVVFDPACGTGGFLVAALDKVRREGADVEDFKRGNLYGIEQDPLVATLAIVNMIFRGDGSSNIFEGDSLRKEAGIKPNKVLMNPPFALKNQYEWQFVDRALEIMKEDGLLFSILPTTTIGGSSNNRKEITWRTQLLKKHTLVAVVKLAEELFYPHVSKGTYGVLIRAKRPHDIDNDPVVWAIHKDGQARTKTAAVPDDNTEMLVKAIGNFVATRTRPDCSPMEMECCPIGDLGGRALDLAPENYIGRKSSLGKYELSVVKKNIEDGRRLLDFKITPRPDVAMDNCRPVFLEELFSEIEKGQSGREKELPPGQLPLISTAEINNGISCFVDERSAKKVYPAGLITISANGGSCFAHYHDYDFAANGDVFVLRLRPELCSQAFSIFVCTAVNGESWRYNYYRKFNKSQLDRLEIRVPVNDFGEFDHCRINQLVSETRGPPSSS